MAVTENKLENQHILQKQKLNMCLAKLINGEKKRTFSLELRISTWPREAETLKNSRQLEITCYNSGKLLFNHNFYLL